MATISLDTLQSSANLSLWFKVRSGAALSLADVSEIIPFRWTYFRDNWSTLWRRLDTLAGSNSNPDYFRATLEDLNNFISQRRLESTDINPFSGSKVYYRFYPIFDALLIEQIGLTNEERRLLEDKKATIRSFSKNDFLKIRRDITAYRDQLADLVGLSDPDYNRIYNRGTVEAQIEPSYSDLNLLRVLQEQIGAVDFVLANLFAVDAVVDPFALARLNANNPDLEIGQYSSGYLVRLHYGEDLQGLAARYLKDSKKWIDIAIANGLREPYIDEIGEQLFLISNGSRDQLNIAALDSNGLANIHKLYINQLVCVQSSTLLFPSQRHITNIKEIPVSGEIVITLSGDPNLDQYRLADQANIRIYKPNTVNSSQFVLIPTAVPLENSRQDELPWFMLSAQADEKKTKIDIAIDDNGALQFTSNGDFTLSYGLANAIQAVRLKMSAEQGSNRYHPAHGLINLAGARNLNESDIKSALIDNINQQIQADPRFDRIESINVERVITTTVAYSINLVVRLAGSRTLLPISFAIAV